jgi:hypothetical protein
MDREHLHELQIEKRAVVEVISKWLESKYRGVDLG